MKTTRRAVAALLAAGCSALLATGAGATSLPVRTFDVSRIAALSASAAHELISPSLSSDGSVVAFVADDAQDGGRQQVYSADTFTGTTAIVSRTPLGQPANGVSMAPSVSADGATVAFESTATDLVDGTGVAEDNIYVALPDGAIELVSATPTGAEPNGASTQPALSGNGDYVAYTSTATDLVGGDHAPRSQVYETNIYTHRTMLVSAARGGGPADGWASNPSINLNGLYVAFDSAGHNLVHVRVRAAQVYLRDTASDHTALVSVTSGGVPQNRAVPLPFRQISSISDSGQVVAFDSNADNLVLGDINDSTDVFVRDLANRTTTLVSTNNAGYEGNNDSFAPSISGDGTKVAFESFASNLAPGGGPADNIFVRDLGLDTTTVADVGATGRPPGREQVGDLLQRPAISGSGWAVVFESSAAGLTGQHSREIGLFMRMLDPPSASFTAKPPKRVTGSSVTLHYRADDPNARSFLCQLDAQTPFTCGPRQVTFRGLEPGVHVLTVRAGGAGMLYQSESLQQQVVITR